MGVFKMGQSGLTAVPNHNALFLEGRAATGAGAGVADGSGGRGGASSVVGVTLHGNRAMLGELQVRR
jgi:predicted ATP-dependent serine protease